MKKLCLFILIIMLSSCSDLTSPELNSTNSANSGTVTTSSTSQTNNSIIQSSNSDVWVGAYLASYNHYVEPSGNWGNLETDNIDWKAFTHLYYFCLKTKSDGTLSPVKAFRNMSPDRIEEIVEAAHEHDKPIIFTIGGWGNYQAFSNAIKPHNRGNLISNIVSTMKKWGFDGIDIDMEPIKSHDVNNYIAFVDKLKTALQNVDVHQVEDPLISVATNHHPQMFAKIQDKIDQINLMTYDLSGAWEGWVSWHNAPVFSGGTTFPVNGEDVPSIDQSVKSFIEAGVSKSKLGIGIDFYGYIWGGGHGTSTGGVTRPGQSWKTKPTVIDNVPYHKIMDDYYEEGEYHWDDKAKAAYISIDKPGSYNDKFITYDNERSIRAKFKYVRDQNLGGTIIWELGGGYQGNDDPEDERDELLQAVKNAMYDGNGDNNWEEDDDEDNWSGGNPNISFHAPTDGSTINGTVNIDISANDNNGLSNVQLFIDGSPVRSFGSSGPFTYSWNSSPHTNHENCKMVAKATDNNGNYTSTSISVRVGNTGSTNPDGGSSATTIFNESLSSNWNDASWNANTNFSSSQRALSGNRSIKVVQAKWGALSLRSGNWNSARDINPGQYQAVEVSVYALNRSADISLMLENNHDQGFPKITHGSIPANQWKTIRIPMEKLNPKGQVIHRLDVLETSGRRKTYFVDNVRFIGGSGESPNSGNGNSQLTIYDDNLANQWMNSSWNAAADFDNTRKIARGNSSIKVYQKSWGGFSIHNGPWDNPVDFNTNGYERLEFKIYTTHPGSKFSISLKSGSTSSTSYETNTIPTYQWKTVSIPIDKLNRNRDNINKINIVETSGKNKNYFIDDLRFTK